MASQWHYQQGPTVQGPVSFGRLAGLLREGELCEDILVRRSGTDEWAPAHSVVGLLHASQRHQHPQSTRQPIDTAPEPGSSVESTSSLNETVQHRGVRRADAERLLEMYERASVEPEPLPVDRRVMMLWAGTGLVGVAAAAAAFYKLIYPAFVKESFEEH